MNLFCEVIDICVRVGDHLEPRKILFCKITTMVLVDKAPHLLINKERTIGIAPTCTTVPNHSCLATQRSLICNRHPLGSLPHDKHKMFYRLLLQTSTIGVIYVYMYTHYPKEMPWESLLHIAETYQQNHHTTIFDVWRICQGNSYYFVV